jgi:Tfp pilus assembly protein PilF
MTKPKRGKLIVWTIILALVVITLLLYGMISRQEWRQQVKTGPTMTAERLEPIYQKGLEYMNKGQWLEAQGMFELVVEADPTYKDTQSRLKECISKMSKPTVSLPSSQTPTVEDYPFEAR